MKNYEGMFLLEPAISATDWDKASGEIKRILEKHKAEITNIDKWGERKLAYSIRKNARGTYVLVYFKAPGEAIPKIKVDCQISEIILRILIIAHEAEPQKVAAPVNFSTPEAEIIDADAPSIIDNYRG